MAPTNNSEALLVSKDRTVLRIMTRVLGEAAFDTTICTHWLRILELTLERNFALLVLDCPETKTRIGAMRKANLDAKKQPRMIVLTNSAARLSSEPLSSTEFLVSKPLTLEKARESLKSSHPQQSPESCTKLCESFQIGAGYGRL